MEFDKSKVYTALNADELKPGSRVIVADDLAYLKLCVEDDSKPEILTEVREESYRTRFRVDSGNTFNLAYLIEEPTASKLKWTDLKIGDVLQNKFTSMKSLVVAIDSDSDSSYHIYVGSEWLDDLDLEHWEKENRDDSKRTEG